MFKKSVSVILAIAILFSVASFSAFAADGKNKTAAPQLLGYSREDGCAEVMLSLMPVYVADGLRKESLSALSARGIETIYTGSGRCLLYSQTDAQFSGLYDRDGVRYVTKKQ